MEDSCDTVLALSLGFGERAASKPRNLWPPLPSPPPRQPSLTLCLTDEICCSAAAAISKTAAASRSSLSYSPRMRSTVSSLTTSNTTNKEILVGATSGGEGAEVVRSSSRESDEEAGTRKKLRLTKEQSALLEDRFKEHSTLNPKQKQALAKQLNLRPRQVEVWFQNRRARTKLKQNEADGELLKRCCETLAEENRRLHKELQELKALKFIPPPRPHPLFTQLPAAANLSLCPSCDRIAGSVGGGVSKAAATDGGTFMLTPKPVPPPHFFNCFAHSAAC